MKLPLILTIHVLVLIAAGSGVAQTTDDTQTWNGVTVRCSTIGGWGGEAHGLEVVKVDPNSPLAAELRGPLPASTRAATPSTFLDRLKAIPIPQAQPGDLIVAINDVRVRCPTSLEEQIAKARAHDAIYLTISRWLPNDTHQTMRIPVELHEMRNAPLTSSPASEPSLAPR